MKPLRSWMLHYARRHLTCAPRTAQYQPNTAHRAPNTALVAKRSLTLALTFAIACTPEPVEWTKLSTDAPTAFTAPAYVIPVNLKLPSTACPNSLAVAQMSATEQHATWWQTDSSGKAQLALARTSDAGVSWSIRPLAESRARANVPCSYPPPAIAADSATGYVHLVYFLQPTEGAGLWYTHSMDRGRSWHAATALIFGDAPARSSIAADGWLLAIAYEAPYAPSRQIWLTLSRDAGHTFERGLSVTQGSMLAVNPRVLLDSRSISVIWTERSQNAVTERTVTRDGVVSIDVNPSRASH